VTRLFLPGRTVIRKMTLGPDAQRRLHHEVAVLERLRGVVGVAQVLDAPHYPGSIALADAGEASLADTEKPLAHDDLIGVAAGLAEAVAGMRGDGETDNEGTQHLSACMAAGRRRVAHRVRRQGQVTVDRGRCRG
jgi:hypothetical protein